MSGEMSGAEALLEMEGIERSFDDGRIHALRGVDVTLRAGQSVALVGRSGSGKSCLLNIACGLDRPDAGTVRWRGRIMTGRRQWARLRRRAIGIVFQEFHLLPTLTARQNIELALPGVPRRTLEERVVTVLDQVGLGAMADRLPTQLSGGERQRVALARALVREPELLFADEPTGNLDSVNAEAVADLMFELQARRAMALVIVTHDPALAQRCERRITLADGRIVEDIQQLGEPA